MSLQPKTGYTPEEYLAIEREAEFKSEYFDGEMFAMTGASRKHNLIAVNVVANLYNQKKKHIAKFIPMICGSRSAQPDYIPIRISSLSAIRLNLKILNQTR